jgi:hypothetical protein
MEDVFLTTGETATLRDYNLQKDSTVFLLARLKGGLQLKIKYDTEEKKVEISNDATVSDLKTHLQGIKALPTYADLSFAGLAMKLTDKLS